TDVELALHEAVRQLADHVADPEEKTPREPVRPPIECERPRGRAARGERRLCARERDGRAGHDDRATHRLVIAEDATTAKRRASVEWQAPGPGPEVPPDDENARRARQDDGQREPDGAGDEHRRVSR